MAVWVVRAGEGGKIIEQVKKLGVVAIGWEQMGDCSGYTTREDFRDAYRRTRPDETNAYRIGIQSGQIYRFIREMQVGDTVMTPDGATREMLIGEVTGEYEFAPGRIDDRFVQLRAVNWKRTVSRDEMSSGLRAATAGLLTIFSIDGFDEEIRRLLEGAPTPTPDAQDVTPQVSFYEDTRARADELISDIIARIDPYDFQDLVAAVLRAMGFRTTVSPPGPDRGTDIVAHPDALGFEEPRIRVQVKHTKGSTGAPDIRNFRSVLAPGEKGLFVSTGGFSPDARREPDRAGAPLTLMDRDRFVDLLTEHYEQMEPEYQAMVPLRKVYIPVKTE